MTGGTLGRAIAQIQRLYGEGTVAGLGESQLLERFIQRRDEAAFTALVERHGPMVMATCRRVLRDEHAAEDAFQATFLLLVRRSGSIRGLDRLGPWLHRVAYRVAVRSVRDRGRRRGWEVSAPESLSLATAAASVGPELRLAIDEALDGMPEKYRAPIILCDLEGRTHDEAAHSLGWPIGTVKGRLSRARDLLRGRLARRGLAPISATLTLALGAEAGAGIPISLIRATLEAAKLFAVGQKVAAGTASVGAALLVEESMRAMMWTKIKILCASLLALGIATGESGVQARQETPLPPAPKPSQAGETPKPNAPPTDLDRLQGQWRLQSAANEQNQLPLQSLPMPFQVVLIRGDKLSMTDGNGQFSTPRTLKLNSQTDPKQFTWLRTAASGAEERTEGIYQIDQDTWTFCYDASTPIVRPETWVRPSHDEILGGPVNLDGKISLTFRRGPDAMLRELQKLQGRWTVETHEEGGRTLNVPGTTICGSTIKIDGRVLTRSGGQSFVAESFCDLDLSRTPHVMGLQTTENAIRLDPEVQRFHQWSYQVKGDRLIFAWDKVRYSNAPTELLTRPGDNRIVLVLQREPTEAPTSIAVAPPVIIPPEPKPGENVIAMASGDDADTPTRETAEREHDRLSGQNELAVIDLDVLKDQIHELRTNLYQLQTARSNPYTKPVPSNYDDILEATTRRLKDLEREYLEKKQKTESQKRTIERRKQSISERRQIKVDNQFPSGEPGVIHVGEKVLIEVLDALPARPITGERLVRPDGKIDLDFYGEVPAAGLTRRQLKEKVVLQLKNHLSDQQLGLIVENPQTKEVVHVAPAESDRVFVDEWPTFGIGRMESREQESNPEARYAARTPDRLKVGDVILVEVLEALPGRPITGERVVRPDGTVSLGFYGDLQAANLTRRELKEKIVMHLRKYLSDEILGLFGEDPETGKPMFVAPADSDRVVVDDSPKYLHARDEAADLGKKLDQMSHEIGELRRRLRSNPELTPEKPR